VRSTLPHASVAFTACLLLAVGCADDPRPAPSARASLGSETTPPAAATSTRLRVSCRTAIRQGEGAGWAVEAERTRACVVLLQGSSARIVSVEPERQRFSLDGVQETTAFDAPTQQVGSQLTPAQLTSHAPLLQGWLPAALPRPGQSWTRTERLALGKLELDVTYRCQVVAGDDRSLMIRMNASGGHLLRQAGLYLQIEGQGTASFHPDSGAWPRTISARYTITASGGQWPDAVSQVELELLSGPSAVEVE